MLSIFCIMSNVSQRGRVVKALVLKTDTRAFAGSNPVADVFIVLTLEFVEIKFTLT